jgi:hypothetical protein
MASSTNVLDNNTTVPLAQSFLKGFECKRVLSKTVDTQLLSGVFNPKSGTTADFRRPVDHKSDRTSDGDISAVDRSDIVVGKATGTVQNYFTVHMDWDEVDQALKMDKLDELVGMPAAERLVTDLELDFGSYMYKNANLHYGTPGTAIDAWSDIAGADALMTSMGVPGNGERCYVMNPYVTTNLANVQSSLSNGKDSLITTAWEDAQISNKFGNMKAMQSAALASFTSGTLSAGANRAGTLSAAPDVTYGTAKDTMTQTLAVTGFGAGTDTIKAGEVVQITGRNRIGLATRSAFTDATGGQVLYAGTVTADVTLSGGAGNIVVAGAGIYEANGQYNTTDTAIASGDVVTIIHPAASTVYQPAMFYHKQAFGIGTVPLKKLYATDTIATTKDGMQIRVSRYSDGDANKQKVRFDLLPAYVTFNPFFAGQGYGA